MLFASICVICSTTFFSIFCCLISFPIIIIMLKNITQKNKVVQNYYLETLIIESQHCEFWLAIHKILKKQFILKRFKIKNENKEIPSKRNNENERDDLQYQKALDQITLLKKIEMDLKPKCHKLIRTNRNVYIVYDDFGGTLLPKFLKENVLDLNQKIQIMFKLTNSLAQIHAQNIALLVLDKNRVNVVNKKSFIFIDWTFAVYVQDSSKIVPIFQQFDQEGANHVLMASRGAFDVDIRNLGQIFKQILNANQKSRPSQVKELKDLINRMIKCFEFNNEKLLQKVMDSLQDMQNKLSKAQHDKSLSNSTHSIDEITLNKRDKMLNSRLQNTISSSHADLPPKTSRYKTQNDESISNTSDISTKSRPIQKKADQSQIQSRIIQAQQLRKNGSSDNLTRNVKSTSEVDLQLNKKSKEISKIRNLAYFVLELSEHVTNLQNFQELSFMLMKFAWITMKTALTMAEDMHDHSQKRVKRQLVLILTQQLGKFKNLMKTFKVSCRQMISSVYLRRELQSDKIESEEYFRDLIQQFGSSQIAMSQSMTSKVDETLNSLFWTYMVLKRKEFGDYNIFWNRVYKPNQKYYNQFQICKEKKFGLRYIRESIKRILTKN